MKKLLFSIALVVISASAFAQVGIGITGGLSLAKTNIHSSGISISTSSLSTFHVGLLIDAPLASSIYFQPQLLLSGKGGKVDDGQGDKSTLNPFYIELPLNFVYKGDVGSGQIFGGVGPYAAVGIFGKEKSGGESQDIKFGSSDDDDYKRTDFGGNIIAGYQFNNGFLISANYSFGLANVANTDSEDDSKVKNSYIGISIGYIFGGSSNSNY